MPCLDTIFYEELKFAIYIFDYKKYSSMKIYKANVSPLIERLIQLYKYRNMYYMD